MDAKPEVLIVDDDPQVRNLLDEVINETGAQSICVASSRVAAELINRHKLEGVILSWELREKNSLDLAKLVRQSKSNPGCLLVMLGRRISRTSARKSFHVGVNYFLQKPLQREQLCYLFSTRHDQMLEERRNYARVPLRMEVCSRWNGRQAKGLTINLSGRGMLVAMADVPPADVDVELEFRLADSQEITRVTARVVRITPEHEVGFRFLAHDRKLRDSLAELLRHAPAGTPA